MAEGEELGSNLLHAAGRGGRQRSVKRLQRDRFDSDLNLLDARLVALDRIDNPIRRRTAKFRQRQRPPPREHS